ncbi:MAG: 4Fe-4S cluster-binding domain-containing protein [Acidobacteria bacterium]|nr:4Fe-4S cluster-binding domain-containing protein [Acidobacteriota bacterium]
MANECLSLILTARCNLHCSYCYQNAKTNRRAEWDAIQAGIDMAFGDGLSQVELMFLGGEPLLEFELLRRAVSYAETLDRDRKCILFSLITNGTLITETIAEYLDEHKFDIQLSFDGVQPAQLYRGDGTFEILNCVLDSFRIGHPQLFRSRLRIALTVIPETVSCLADSVRYLIEKNVPDIFINCCITPCPGWQKEQIHELDRAFASIAELSRNHVEQTAAIPVMLLRKSDDEIAKRGHQPPLCSALTGRTLALDPDGQLYTCPMFAESYQKFQPGSLMEKAAMLKLGDVTDPEIRKRRSKIAESVRSSDLWTSLEGCYSSYGKCEECDYYGRCSVCPVSIWQTPNAAGPYRIPDFVCAFNRLALKYRDQFPSVPTALKKFLPEAESQVLGKLPAQPE